LKKVNKVVSEVDEPVNNKGVVQVRKVGQVIICEVRKI
jgi:predicted polyphosphate/ATP-dependent NAD kinase